MLVKVFKLLAHNIHCKVVASELLRLFLFFLSKCFVIFLLFFIFAVVTSLIQQRRVGVIQNLLAEGSNFHQVFQESFHVCILNLVIVLRCCGFLRLFFLLTCCLRAVELFTLDMNVVFLQMITHVFEHVRSLIFILSVC